MEAGHFDDLEGMGRPLPSAGFAYEPDWWARAFVRRERIRDRADALRRVIRSELPGLRLGGPAVADRIAQLDAAIDRINAELHPDDRIPLLDL